MLVPDLAILKDTGVHPERLLSISDKRFLVHLYRVGSVPPIAILADAVKSAFN